MEVQQHSDRRTAQRKSLLFNVAIYYDGLGIIRCRTQNVSLNGMLVETGIVGLPHGATVDLALISSNSDFSNPCRVPADIVRVDEDGTALEFRELSLSSYSTIYKLLFPN